MSQLAVQSYCFRNFPDINTLIEKVKETGLKAVEVCGVHIDFQDTSTHQEAISTFKREGVDIVSIGVNTLTDNEKENRALFEFAQKAELSVMSVNFNFEQNIGDILKMAEKLGDEYQINLAIHNHGGYHWLGNREALSWVFGQTSPRIGLCLDTAWALDAKQDPIQMVETYSERLYSIHLKDFIFNEKRESFDTIIGEGNISLDKLSASLKKVGFSGEAIIEYEANPENPVPALKECVEKIKREMGDLVS